MKNESAKPREDAERVPRSWPADSVRYWCQHLRALADLMEAGEPLEFVQSYRGAGPDELESFTVIVRRWRLASAFLEVERRVASGDPDYAIRMVPPGPDVRPPARKRR